jgi:hypothetical protein
MRSFSLVYFPKAGLVLANAAGSSIPGEISAAEAMHTIRTHGAECMPVEVFEAVPLIRSLSGRASSALTVYQSGDEYVGSGVSGLRAPGAEAVPGSGAGKEQYRIGNPPAQERTNKIPRD